MSIRDASNATAAWPMVVVEKKRKRRMRLVDCIYWYSKPRSNKHRVREIGLKEILYSWTGYFVRISLPYL